MGEGRYNVKGEVHGKEAMPCPVVSGADSN